MRTRKYGVSWHVAGSDQHPMDALDRLNPEQRARVRIDEMLEAAGWELQATPAQSTRSSPGVAVREFQTMTGPVDTQIILAWSLFGVSVFLGLVAIGTYISQLAESSLTVRRGALEVFSLVQWLAFAAGVSCSLGSCSRTSARARHRT